MLVEVKLNFNGFEIITSPENLNNACSSRRCWEASVLNFKISSLTSNE
jgi:hypothetical protein